MGAAREDAVGSGSEYLLRQRLWGNIRAERFQALVDGLEHQRYHQHDVGPEDADVSYHVHQVVVYAQHRTHPEAVEPVHDQTEAVVNGQNAEKYQPRILVIENRFDIAVQIGLREHDALALSRGARGVDDHGHVVLRRRLRLVKALTCRFQIGNRFGTLGSLSRKHPDLSDLRAAFPDRGNKGGESFIQKYALGIGTENEVDQILCGKSRVHRNGGVIARDDGHIRLDPVRGAETDQRDMRVGKALCGKALPDAFHGGCKLAVAALLHLLPDKPAHRGQSGILRFTPFPHGIDCFCHGFPPFVSRRDTLSSG